jgi:hypothetical protein
VKETKLAGRVTGHIPKDASGKETRPIGIPAIEDKILQKAVCMILEPIYEQDFLECSYGYRPGRSPHDALDAVWRQSMGIGVEVILVLDIRKFFDSPDKTRLVRFVKPGGSDRKGPDTFDFLGFTHYWGKSRNGNWVIKRKTVRKRLNKALRGIAAPGR